MPALIPQHWKDSQLVWIAKPNKDPSKSQGYRPIGSPIHLPRASTSSLGRGSGPTWNRSYSTYPSLPTPTAGRLDALLRVHSHLRNARLLSLQGRAAPQVIEHNRFVVAEGHALLIEDINDGLNVSKGLTQFGERVNIPTPQSVISEEGHACLDPVPPYSSLYVLEYGKGMSNERKGQECTPVLCHKWS